jgi:hypothetical protein
MVTGWCPQRACQCFLAGVLRRAYHGNRLASSGGLLWYITGWCPQKVCHGSRLVSSRACYGNRLAHTWRTCVSMHVEPQSDGSATLFPGKKHMLINHRFFRWASVPKGALRSSGRETASDQRFPMPLPPNRLIFFRFKSCFPGFLGAR